MNWKKILNVSPAFVFSLLITLALTYYSHELFNYRARHEDNKKTPLVTEALDVIDLKVSDIRFKLRGEKPSDAPVALLSIDDDSVQELGRWPWDRDFIAQVIEELMKYDARTVGFDIVFSEPQNSPHLADDILAKTIDQHKDKIVLGVFKDHDQYNLFSYRDYCFNELFAQSNGTEIVKLNPSFVLEDKDDPYETIDFSKLFTLAFSIVEKETSENILKKLTVPKLNERQMRYMNKQIKEAKQNYCQNWLSEKDFLLHSDNKKIVEPLYQEIFQSKNALETIIQEFKNNVRIHPIPQSIDWTSNISKIQNAALYTGSFNADQDSDGTIRKNPTIFRSGNRIGLSFIPSLAIQTYLTATGYQAQFEIIRDPLFPSQKKISKVQIVDPHQTPEKIINVLPVDGRGLIKLNYYGDTAMLPHLPVKELLSEKDTLRILKRQFDSQRKTWVTHYEEVNKKDFIKNRSFIFGATAVGIYDLRVTPFQKNYPGPETHVTMLANLFENNFTQTITSEPRWMPWLLLIVGLILGYIFSASGAFVSTILFVGCNIALAVFDWWLYIYQKTTFSSVLIVILIFTLFAFTNIYKYFTEEKRKKYIRGTFSKFVSPAIVDEILKNPANLQLGGKKQNMSVFFSDVRGFTTISEKLDPQQLSDVLNKYLTPMTEIVFKNKGTLDKYMGDAIMAFFGAPIFYPDHATYACRCALESLKELEELKKEFKLKNLPEIDIGIGVNTGDMSVGNMGSEIVRNYTVMGDAVNLASRLEGINKEYGTRIIISEFTQKEIAQQFTTREVDIVKVKGKNKPVRIYELICEGKPSSEMEKKISIYNQAYDLYQKRNFTEALILFQSLQSTDPLSGLYVERCQEFIENTPPPDWDGVFVMKTK